MHVMRHSRSLAALAGPLLLVTGVAAQTNALVSTSTAGVLANDRSYYSQISADGRYVVFQSKASNLVAGDNNGRYDIFRRNLQTGTTDLVSVSTAGFSGNGLGLSPTVSGDGRFVAWESDATNVISGDTNGTWDVFLRDMTQGVTTRISLTAGGGQAGQRSGNPRLTPDARFIVFESDAALVASDTNGLKDAYFLELATGQLEQISVTAGGVQGNNWSFHCALSDDGRFVCFSSSADNLVAGDTNGRGDVFVKDRTMGTIIRVNVSSAGVQSNGESTWPSISGDGQTIAYCSRASTLVVGDTSNHWDLFAFDVPTATTTRLNVQPSGAQANSYVRSPNGISADGRFVIFASLSTNLVPGDTNGFQDIFIRDRQLGVTERVSLNAMGLEPNDDSFVPHMTPDKRVITYTSEASDLVAGDTNGLRDIFAASLVVSIGTPYCVAIPNSTGMVGSLAAYGQSAVSANDVLLEATDLPLNAFGFYITSQTQGFTFPTPGAGNLCIAGSIGRYVGSGQIKNSGPAGVISLQLDLAMIPTPTGFVAAAAGETWNFQCWHRDVFQGGLVGSNFTRGLELTLQ